MTNERLEQLLIKCMDWIAYDNCDTYDTFNQLGFGAAELEKLGFGYLVENALDSLANDIVMELESCGFDDVTDSSGYFAIKEFPDGSERCVDVYKSTNDGNPHYVVCCFYENEEHDYEYTKDLTTEALVKVLRGIYEEERLI